MKIILNLCNMILLLSYLQFFYTVYSFINLTPKTTQDESLSSFDMSNFI